MQLFGYAKNTPVAAPCSPTDGTESKKSGYNQPLCGSAPPWLGPTHTYRLEGVGWYPLLFLWPG